MFRILSPLDSGATICPVLNQLSTFSLFLLHKFIRFSQARGFVNHRWADCGRNFLRPVKTPQSFRTRSVAIATTFTLRCIPKQIGWKSCAGSLMISPVSPDFYLFIFLFQESSIKIFFRDIRTGREGWIKANLPIADYRTATAFHYWEEGEFLSCGESCVLRLWRYYKG